MRFFLLCSFYLTLTDAAVTVRDVTDMRQTVRLLMTQLLSQRHYIEQRLRHGGNSGVRRMRIGKFGFRPYMSASHVDADLVHVHGRVNTKRDLGLGEMVVVINGVQFRTGGGGYVLQKKHSESNKFKATEDIEFPEVPPEVLEKKTLKGQVEEMKEWFKAWKEEDDSKRDYKKYFKPVLCYMEGFWMTTDTNHLAEYGDPYDTDDYNWAQTENEARFMSLSGGSYPDNAGYLPTAFMHWNASDERPVFAQWNYQILCHPLRKDVPRSAFRPVTDIKTQLAFNLSSTKYAELDAARFSLRKAGRDVSRRSRNFLDELMEEVPGLDNYLADVKDEAVDGEVFPYPAKDGRPLNAGFYHRLYEVKDGSPGVKVKRRSYVDETLFVALNTRREVAQETRVTCHRQGEPCRTLMQRWSYAIPLEIVYLTPLTKWNPHGVRYRSDAVSSQYENGYFWTLAGSSKDPVGDIDDNHFYQTPYEFYESATDARPPDDVGGVVFVRDRRHGVQPVRATGVYVSLPRIPGVGVLRQRYPIMPVYGEGSDVWKELAALEDVIADPERRKELFDF